MPINIEDVIEKLINSEKCVSKLEHQLLLSEKSLTDISTKLELQCNENKKLCQKLQEMQMQMSVIQAELEAEIKGRCIERKRLIALEKELDEVKREHDSKADEAEIALFQLQQVQKELEYHFYQSCGKSQLLEKNYDQQKRIKELIPKLLDMMRSQSS